MYCHHGTLPRATKKLCATIIQNTNALKIHSLRNHVAHHLHVYMVLGLPNDNRMQMCVYNRV